jgi:hypothetical protein
MLALMVGYVDMRISVLIGFVESIHLTTFFALEWSCFPCDVMSFLVPHTPNLPNVSFS